MITRLPQVALMAVLASALCLASTGPEGFRTSPVRHPKRVGTERLLSGSVNILNFAPLEEADVVMACGSSQPPKALATPHSVLTAIPDNVTITVNFIIGTDGQVYSPFVLDGAGASLDRRVVETVRRWRYVPALCNGAPTEAEVKVRLSSR